MLTLSIRTAKPLEAAADVLVLGVWAFAPKETKKDTKRKAEAKAPLPEPLESLDRALGGGVSALVAKDEFMGKRDQTLSISTLGKLPSARILVMGLGARSGFGDGEARSFAAKAARAANGEKAKTLAIAVPEGLETRARALAEGVELGAYRFTKYLTGDRKPKAELAEVQIVTGAKAVGVQAKKDLGHGAASRRRGPPFARPLERAAECSYPRCAGDCGAGRGEDARLRVYGL